MAQNQTSRRYIMSHLNGFAAIAVIAVAGLALLAAAVLCYLAYAAIAPASLLWLLACPALARHAQRIFRAADPVCAGRELKAIVLITCAINLLFSLGLCFVT